VARESLAIRNHAERIARLPRDAARAELAGQLDSGKVHAVGSAAHKGALDYNARLVTAVRESYERRGRKTCWAPGAA
jgi:hypothetical protein